MANKDPAFLFYASDFLTGTMFMSNEQVGKYMRLLCSQHQHGGLIDKISFNSLVGEDLILLKKFIESKDGFYNERLADEMESRCKKSTNISSAAKETWAKRKKEIQKNTIVKKSYKKGSAIAIQPEDEDEVKNENIVTHERVVKETVENEMFCEQSAMALKCDYNVFVSFIDDRLAEMKITGHSTKYPLGTVKNILLQDFKLMKEKEKRNGNQTRKGHDIEGVTSAAREVLRKHNLEKYGAGD